MTVSTISEKGQITLPAAARRRVGIKPKDRVIIETTDDAIIIKPVEDFFELEGFLGEALPEEEEREAVRKAVAKHRRKVTR